MQDIFDEADLCFMSYKWDKSLNQELYLKKSVHGWITGLWDKSFSSVVSFPFSGNVSFSLFENALMV